MCYQAMDQGTIIINNLNLMFRDIKAGELMMSSEAVVVGPRLLHPPPFCVGCHQPGRKTSECPRCGLPVCGSKCGDSQQHRQECSLIRRVSDTALHMSSLSN